jgi:hypothetical protein
LAHCSCGLNSSPILFKKIAKLQVDLAEYDYKIYYYFSRADGRWAAQTYVFVLFWIPITLGYFWIFTEVLAKKDTGS